MKTVKEALMNIRGFLSDENRWCRFYTFMGKAGREINSIDFINGKITVDQIEKCCLSGACLREADGDKELYNAIVNSFPTNIPKNSITFFNDTSTHKQILEFIDQVINENT